MKIIREQWNGSQEVNLESAIYIVLYKTGYDSGQFERLSERIDNISNMLSKLISMLDLKPDQVQELLGYGFEVEEK